MHENPIIANQPVIKKDPLPSLSDPFEELNQNQTQTPQQEYSRGKSLRNTIILFAFVAIVMLGAGVYYIWQNTDLPKILRP